jgi:integrase
MPRTLNDTKIHDAAHRRAAAKADKNRDTFWHQLKLQSLALGWRRNGQWVVRSYGPGKDGKDRYKQWALKTPDGKKKCIADDYVPANGVDILSYKQAEDAALKATEPAKKTDITVRQACESYINDHLAVHQKRSREVRLTFEVQVYPKLGDIAVRELTKTELEQWFHAQAKRLKSNGEERGKGDCNRTLAYLKAALNRAYSDEANGIPSDKAWGKKGVKAFRDADKSRCDFYLDPSQVQRLLAVTTGGLHALIKAAFLTGARPPHELSGIRAKHFDAERGTVKIEQSKTKRREVTLSSEARTFFSELSQGKKPDDLLLTRDNGGAWVHGNGHDGPLKCSYHVAPFRQAVIRAELPEGTTLYVLRHSFISLAIASPGCNILQLARHCGTSVEMIEAHYGHFRHDDSRRMVEAFSPKLGLRVVA